MRSDFYCILASVLPFSGIAQGQSNLVLFISSPGEYLGAGQTYYTTNPAAIGVNIYPAPLSAIQVWTKSRCNFLQRPRWCAWRCEKQSRIRRKAFDETQNLT
jgi:hypothetical protein